MYSTFRRLSLYIQGRSPSPGLREYFYYIDHQGQLFLDDVKIKNFITCFKDKEFLAFFFKRLKLNTNAKKYAADFPYVSPCGREQNYVRCDDRPIVFTHHVDPRDESEHEHGYLSYGGAGNKLAVPFEPSKIYARPGSGRLYHPSVERIGGVGLIKSSLAIELSRYFEFCDGPEETSAPTHFNWKGSRFALDNSLGSYM